MLVCEYKESKLIKGSEIYKKQINKQRRKREETKWNWNFIGLIRIGNKEEKDGMRT